MGPHGISDIMESVHVDELLEGVSQNLCHIQVGEYREGAPYRQ